MTLISRNFSEYILRHAQTRPDLCALDLPDHRGEYQSLTYAELATEVAVYQQGLKAQGYEAGDRVILIFPPDQSLYCLVLALLASGMVPVFVDMGMGRKRIGMAIEDAKAKAIISTCKLLRLKPILKPLWGKALYSVDGECRYADSVAALRGEGAGDVEVYPCAPEQHGLITFTSGSTGRPKGADRTHESLIQQHLALLAHEPVAANDCSFTSLPITALHTLACGISTVLPPVDLANLADIDADGLVAAIIKKEATVLSGAPAYMQQLAETLLERQITLGHVRLLLVGGAVVSPALAKLLLEAFPHAEVNIVYGSTESEPISSISAQQVTDFSQGVLVGRPCESAQVVIANLPEQDKGFEEAELATYACAPGEIGELLVKGPHVLKSYVDNPEASRESKIACADGEVWHRTGDSAYLDDQGNIYLVGRQKDRVWHQGRVVHPYPIELGVDALPQVARSALLNIEGQAVLAYKAIDPVAAPQAIAAYLAEQQLEGVSCVELETLPVDGRHNSKLDRPTLIARVKALSCEASGRWIVRLNRVDCLTLSGVVAAFAAIVLSMSGHFAYAIACLFLAMLADALDGIWARRRGIERNFGRYLDGFVDELDYLIAPSMLLYAWGFDQLYQIAILLTFMMSGMVRLSVFNDVGNIKSEAGLGYLGMPVFWSVFIVAIAYLLALVAGQSVAFAGLSLALPVMSVLMVYRAPFFKFKSLKQILIIVLSGLSAFTLIGVLGG